MSRYRQIFKSMSCIGEIADQVLYNNCLPLIGPGPQMRQMQHVLIYIYHFMRIHIHSILPHITCSLSLIQQCMGWAAIPSGGDT